MNIDPNLSLPQLNDQVNVIWKSIRHIYKNNKTLQQTDIDVSGFENTTFTWKVEFFFESMS